MYFIIATLVVCQFFIGDLVAACGCNKCPKKNEHHDCGSFCQTECDFLDEDCPVKTLVCVDGCFCNEGLARNRTGDCIPIKSCPPKDLINRCRIGFKCTCDSPFETYGSSCEQTCSSLYLGCHEIKEGCYCKKGYARNDQGNCVPEDACPVKIACALKPNEEYSCGSACQTLCSTLGKPCPIVNIVCNRTCYCKKRFARNANGVCIPISQCAQLCGQNEDYGTACEENCARLYDSCTQINNGCYCKLGYARSSGGACIPENLCPWKLECASRINEEYQCGTECQTTCATLGQPCDKINKKCNQLCYCKDGYARNAQEICIPTGSC